MRKSPLRKFVHSDPRNHVELGRPSVPGVYTLVHAVFLNAVKDPRLLFGIWTLLLPNWRRLVPERRLFCSYEQPVSPYALDQELRERATRIVCRTVGK